MKDLKEMAIVHAADLADEVHDEIENISAVKRSTKRKIQKIEQWLAAVLGFENEVK